MERAATRRIRKEAVLLWDSGEVVTEVYRDIEISAYAEYRYYGFKSASKVSKKRQPYYYGFLAEVTIVGLPTLPQNCTWLRAILNRSVSTHIEALELAKILVDKLLDVGINEGMREQLSQSGSGFIMTDLHRIWFLFETTRRSDYCSPSRCSVWLGSN